MSTKLSRESGENPKIVVRAFRGMPVPMVCRGTGGGRVRVAREGGTQTISLPKQSVFQFSASLYEKMRAAWDAGDLRLLSGLWDSAEPAFRG